jgi:hypothetical protein
MGDGTGGRRRDRRAHIVTAVFAALVVALLARNASLSGQGAQGTGFSIAVDFLALDGQGRPVSDLRTDEVVVRLGRDPADVYRLTFVPAASGPINSASQSRVQPFGSSEARDFERRFLIVVDDESLPQGSEQSTRDAVATFVRTLDSRDRVSLATVPRGGLRVPLTSEHAQVARAVQRISGRALRRESEADAACRTRSVLRELEALFAQLANPAGPFFAVFFSGGLYDGGAEIQTPGAVIACDLQLSDFRQLGIRAAASRSFMYIVQPETFSSPPWTSNPRAGLEHVAGVTGGRILQLSGRDVDVLDRVRVETTGVHLAIARLRSQPRGGIDHPLSVRVRRPGVVVVARPQLTVPAERPSTR